MQSFITAKHAEIADLCRTHHVRRLSIFGSAVRDDFDPATSDVDIRIEFDEEASTTTPTISTTCTIGSRNSSAAKSTSSALSEIRKSRPPQDHRKRASDSLCGVISASIAVDLRARLLPNSRSFVKDKTFSDYQTRANPAPRDRARVHHHRRSHAAHPPPLPGVRQVALKTQERSQSSATSSSTSTTARRR